jgi:hypothetical protein
MSKTRQKRKIIGRFNPKSTVVRFEHPAEFYPELQPDSTHVLTCPECGGKHYVDKRFVESMKAIGEVEGPTAIGVVHRGCEVQLQISPIQGWRNWQDVKRNLEK